MRMSHEKLFFAKSVVHVHLVHHDVCNAKTKTKADLLPHTACQQIKRKHDK